MTAKVTDRQIREHLGHGVGSRRVRIRRDGQVEYYGSTDATDRQHDYWHYAGQREELSAGVAGVAKWLQDNKDDASAAIAKATGAE